MSYTRGLGAGIPPSTPHPGLIELYPGNWYDPTDPTTQALLRIHPELLTGAGLVDQGTTAPPVSPILPIQNTPLPQAPAAVVAADPAPATGYTATVDTATSWLTQEGVASIPNWALVSGAAMAAVLVFGGHR